MVLINQICKITIYVAVLYIFALSYIISIGTMYTVKDRFINMITPSIFAGITMIIVYFMIEDFGGYGHLELGCKALYIIMIAIADIVGNEMKVKYRVSKLCDIMLLALVIMLVSFIAIFKGGIL